MSSKTYEQKVARLVQEATGAAYMTALRWTNEHVIARPERMTKEERALAIVEATRMAGWPELRGLVVRENERDVTIQCPQCEAAWSHPKRSPTGDTVLFFLNHAASHDGPKETTA